MADLPGIALAGQALAWAVAWSRKAGHPLTQDRYRPTARAVAALTRAVEVVATWGASTEALSYRWHYTLPVASAVSECMTPRSPAGWNVSLKASWRFLEPLLPGIDSYDTFKRRAEAAPAGSVLAELWAQRTDDGFPAEAVFAARDRLQA